MQWWCCGCSSVAGIIEDLWLIWHSKKRRRIIGRFKFTKTKKKHKKYMRIQKIQTQIHCGRLPNEAQWLLPSRGRRQERLKIVASSESWMKKKPWNYKIHKFFYSFLQAGKRDFKTPPQNLSIKSKLFGISLGASKAGSKYYKILSWSKLLKF